MQSAKYLSISCSNPLAVKNGNDNKTPAPETSKFVLKSESTPLESPKEAKVRSRSFVHPTPLGAAVSIKLRSLLLGVLSSLFFLKKDDLKE